MDDFERFWTLYPRRDGENPKQPARLVFERLIKKGIDPNAILDAVERFRMQMQEKRKIDTEFIPHARTWLNQHRFEGYSLEARKSVVTPEQQSRLQQWWDNKRKREGWT